MGTATGDGAARASADMEGADEARGRAGRRRRARRRWSLQNDKEEGGRWRTGPAAAAAAAGIISSGGTAGRRLSALGRVPAEAGRGGGPARFVWLIIDDLADAGRRHLFPLPICGKIYSTLVYTTPFH
jgi:hypothetical protein